MKKLILAIGLTLTLSAFAQVNDLGGNVRVSSITGGTFTGSGSGLTNLDAGQLTTGLVPIGRLTTVNTNLVGAVLTTDGVGNRYWTNALANFSSISVTNLTAVTTLRIGEGPGGGTLSASTDLVTLDNNLQVNGGTGFTGKGGNLTELNASQLTTGTVPAGRLTTAGTNLVGAVLTSDGVGNRYWTNAITNFSSVAATNLVAGSSVTAGSSTITTSLIRSAGSMYVGSGASLIFDWGNQDSSILRHSIGTIRVRTNAVVDGYISSTNGFVDVPRSSAPTFAQIGSRTNTPVMWWSNSAPCVRYVTYYNASSNEVTTNLFSLP